MPETIRGMSVEVSADTKKFNTAMRGLSKDVSTAQGELSALKKSLVLEYDDSKFKRAQQVAQEALDKTSEKTEALRQRIKYLEQGGAVDTSEYRKLQAELSKADAAALSAKKQLEEINQIKFDHLAGQVDKISQGLTTAGNALKPLSAGAAAAVTGLGALGVKAASTGAEIDDLSLRLGISAEKVQEMQYVAVQCGVDFDVFQKGLIKARAALLDLDSGKTTEQAKAIAALGISMSDFDSNDEMFDGILGALADMEDKTQQAALANEIFGDKVAYQLLPYLNSGAEAFEQFKGEFSEMSSLSNEQVSSLAKLDDTIFRLKESVKYAALQIGASFAPLLQKISETVQSKVIPKLQALADWFNSLSLSQQEFAAKALLVVAALAPVLLTLGKVTKGVGSLISLIPKIGSALSTLAANPIILIIGVVAGLLAALYATNENFRESINNLVGTLGEALAPILNTIMELVATLFEVLGPIISLLGDILAPVLEIVMSFLSPLIGMVSMLFKFLQPLINLALVPLKIAFQALQVPLQMLGSLLNWLAPIFNIFAKVIQGVFGFVLKIINTVLGAIETAINWVIGKINSLIDGINNIGGWLGIHIERLQEVKLQIETGGIDDFEPNDGVDTSGAPTENDFAYDNTGTPPGTGDTYFDDHSTNNTTQNVTVVIENYAAEIDVDDMVQRINVKLAEQL